MDIPLTKCRVASIDHFMNSKPFRCDFDSPRVLCIAEDVDILFVLPYHSSSNSYTITVVDMWSGESFNVKTKFPIDCCQTTEACYYNGFLYVCGIRGSTDILCRYDFNCSVWETVKSTNIDFNSCHYYDTYFAKDEDNNLMAILINNGKATVADINKEHKVTFREMGAVNMDVSDQINNGVAFAGTFDGKHHYWKFLFCKDSNKMQGFALNLKSFSWEKHDLPSHPALLKTKACGYYNCQIKGDELLCFMPHLGGTKIFTLPLNNIENEEWSLEQEVSDIIVWAILNNVYNTVCTLRVFYDKSGQGLLSVQQRRFQKEFLVKENILKSVWLKIKDNDGAFQFAGMPEKWKTILEFRRCLLNKFR